MEIRRLSIQIQPRRAPALDLREVSDLCRKLGADRRIADGFQTDDKREDGYIDLTFETADCRALWRNLRRLLFDDVYYGPQIRICAIVICQGDDGWNDYLLLSHFDSSEALDEF